MKCISYHYDVSCYKIYKLFQIDLLGGQEIWALFYVCHSLNMLNVSCIEFGGNECTYIGK